MVQNQKPVANGGTKGLGCNARPNDGSKTAKRSFKSQQGRGSRDLVARGDNRGQKGFLAGLPSKAFPS
jgi:hypothetical protein